MGKSKKHARMQGDSVWHLSSEEATLAAKPRYNGFACGTGVHGDVKYNRARQKRRWDKQLSQEGASMRGPFPFAGGCAIEALLRRGETL